VPHFGPVSYSEVLVEVVSVGVGVGVGARDGEGHILRATKAYLRLFLNLSGNQAPGKEFCLVSF
jgi:hypothetical protein